MTHSHSEPTLHDRFTLRVADAFTIDAGLDELDRRLESEDALREVRADPPSATGERLVAVLAPGRPGREARFTIEVFGGRPRPDRLVWQQVSEDPLLVLEAFDPHTGGFDEAQLLVQSANDWATFDLPEGAYRLEVSGRGLDAGNVPEWRLRLWPEDGVTPPPPTRWSRPEGWA